MTNLTANISRPHKGNVEQQRYPLVGYTAYQGGSAAYTVFKGAVMMMDVSDVDGYAQPMLSTITAASGDIFCGIAEEKVLVTSADTADGTKDCLCMTEGLVGFPKGSIAVTDTGAAVYATDDTAITLTSTNALWIGYVMRVDDTYAWVDIEPAAGRANTVT